VRDRTTQKVGWRCRTGVADLAEQYGVARNTVTKARRRLADDGLVEIVPSWGIFRARS
jgi:Mn-dependent DtxR family transcriptional regulator